MKISFTLDSLIRRQVPNRTCLLFYCTIVDVLRRIENRKLSELDINLNIVTCSPERHIGCYLRFVKLLFLDIFQRFIDRIKGLEYLKEEILFAAFFVSVLE